MYKILTSLFFLLFLFDFILKNDAKAACVSVGGVLQSNSVNNLLGVVEFAEAANVTTSTTNVEILFNVGEGMFVENISGGMLFGSGPFQSTITVN